MTKNHRNASGAVENDNQPFAERAGRGGRVAIVAGVPITNADKLWWHQERITKLEAAQYYSNVAPRMLPWLDNRLLTAERCPEGIEGGCFFEKNFVTGLPTHAVPTEGTGKTVHYVVGGSKTTLLSLVNLGCIAVHVMNCEVGSLDQPDWLAFDLDPSNGLFADAAKAAGLLKKLLEELRIRSFPKTTGGRGLHVLVPLRRGPNQETVRGVARSLSARLALIAAGTITVQMRKAQRQDRVFADWLRNAFGQTMAAPYSIRCRPGAPVSTPLHWDEVRPGLDPLRFNVRTIQNRLEAADPWAGFWEQRQELPKELILSAEAKP